MNKIDEGKEKEELEMDMISKKMEAIDKLRKMINWFNAQDEHFNNHFKSIRELEMLYDYAEENNIDFLDTYSLEEIKNLVFKKNTKHYGKFLAWAGNPVKYKSEDIERKLIEKQNLIEKLKQLEIEIANEEKYFEKFIASEWTDEEIKEAKQKAGQYK